MPIYVYHASDVGCDYCSNDFEVIQSVDASPLFQCPRCGGPVRKIFAGFTVSKSILSPSNLAEKGFTQYRKKSDGVYEKTAGKGPDILKKK